MSAPNRRLLPAVPVFGKILFQAAQSAIKKYSESLSAGDLTPEQAQQVTQMIQETSICLESFRSKRTQEIVANPQCVTSATDEVIAKVQLFSKTFFVHASSDKLAKDEKILRQLNIIKEAARHFQDLQHGNIIVDPEIVSRSEDWAKNLLIVLFEQESSYAEGAIHSEAILGQEWAHEFIFSLIEGHFGEEQIERGCKLALQFAEKGFPHITERLLDSLLVHPPKNIPDSRCSLLCKMLPLNINCIVKWHDACVRQPEHPLVEYCFISSYQAEFAPMQNVLMVLSKCVGNSHSLWAKLGQHINHFQRESTCFPIARLSQVNRLDCVSRLKVRVPQDDKSAASASGKWEDLPITLRLSIQLKLLQREQELISFCVDGADLGQVISTPVTTCAPRCKAMLIGNMEDFIYGIEAAAFLAGRGVQVCSLVQNANPSWGQDLSNVRLIQGAEACTLWVQDCCFMASRAKQAFFQIPHLVGELDSAGVLVARLERANLRLEEKIQGELTDSPLGRQASKGNQIGFIDYLIRSDPTMRSFRLNFTYDEGGNNLSDVFKTGARRGQHYVIVGKDTVAINQRLISRELAQIGLVYAQGAWQLRDPIEGDLPQVPIPFVRALIAKDRGVVREDNIIDIEQPDYHLDTSVSIGENDVIVVNDSLEALRIYKENEFTDRVNAAFTGGSAGSGPGSSSVDWSDSSQTQALRDVIDKECEALARKAALASQFERLACDDLMQRGCFRVKRVPGRFKRADQTEFINFFNFTAIRSFQRPQVNILTLYCPTMAFRQKALAFLKNELEISVETDNVFFLEKEDSEGLLKSHGGIHCITKPMGFPFK